jgi:glycosyltransferase involved in cell wall biosynthesis
VRITLFHNTYRIRGGEERTVDFETDLLTEAGHEVRRYEVSNEVVFGRPRLAAATSVLRAAWNRESYRAVRKYLEEVRPDVSHVHNWFPLLSPSIYAAHHHQNVPVVQTLHNYRLGCAAGTFLRDGRTCELCMGGDLRPAIRNRCYRDSAVQTQVWCRVMGRGWSQGTFESMVDAYIAPSKVVARKHAEMGLPSDRIHVVHHACDDPQPTMTEADIRARLSGARGAVFVGRLSPEKGVDTLVEAWRGLDVPLRIVGTGPEEERLRALAGDQPSIEFLGELPHAAVIDELRRAGMLVFPSRWDEPFGLAIIEAMACGTPVIATNRGAAPELVNDRVTGLLVPSDDPAALRNAALYTARTTQHRVEMGVYARSWYRMRFAPEIHRRTLENVFATARSAPARREAV